MQMQCVITAFCSFCIPNYLLMQLTTLIPKCMRKNKLNNRPEKNSTITYKLYVHSANMPH